MTTPNEIGWGSYDKYEGPFWRGSAKYTLPSNPTDADRVLATITKTEGGAGDAINAYDRCTFSAGFIQFCEGTYAVSDLLGSIAERSLHLYGGLQLLEPLQPALEEAKATFKKNTDKAKWRFFFNDSRGEVDNTGEQKQLFLLHSTGEKGTWDQASKDYAKVWAACCANTLQQPEAIQAQVDFTLPRLLKFAYGDAKTQIFDENLQNDGWVGALRAGYLSFAANLPAVAAKQAMIAIQAATAPKWSPGWCIAVLKQLTFGPGITIYPKRYEAIRPALESLYGVDLPDFSADLAAWKASQGMTDSGPHFDSVEEIQTELIAEGYDLGPSGADGVVGGKTTAAVRTFQQLHGLDADGVVGAKTRQALAGEAAKRG